MAALDHEEFWLVRQLKRVLIKTYYMSERGYDDGVTSEEMDTILAAVLAPYPKADAPPLPNIAVCDDFDWDENILGKEHTEHTEVDDFCEKRWPPGDVENLWTRLFDHPFPKNAIRQILASTPVKRIGDSIKYDVPVNIQFMRDLRQAERESLEERNREMREEAKYASDVFEATRLSLEESSPRNLVKRTMSNITIPKNEWEDSSDDEFPAPIDWSSKIPKTATHERV